MKTYNTVCSVKMLLILRQSPCELGQVLTRNYSVFYIIARIIVICLTCSLWCVGYTAEK